MKREGGQTQAGLCNDKKITTVVFLSPSFVENGAHVGVYGLAQDPVVPKPDGYVVLFTYVSLSPSPQIFRDSLRSALSPSPPPSPQIFHEVLKGGCVRADGSRVLVLDIGANSGYFTVFATMHGCCW